MDSNGSTAQCPAQRHSACRLQAATPPAACRRRRRRHADAGNAGAHLLRCIGGLKVAPDILQAGGGVQVRLAGVAHACGGGPSRHAPSCAVCRVPRLLGAIWRPPTCVSASLSFPSFSTLNRQKPAELSKSSSMVAGGWRMRRCTAAGCWVPQGGPNGALPLERRCQRGCTAAGASPRHPRDWSPNWDCSRGSWTASIQATRATAI